MTKTRTIKKPKSVLFSLSLILAIVLNVLANPLISAAASVRYITGYSIYMDFHEGGIDFSRVDFSQGVNLIEVGKKGLNVGDFVLYQKITTKNYLEYYSPYMPVSSAKRVIYKSSNPSVASVSKTGDVTLKKTGEVCIAVKLKNDSSDMVYYLPLRVMEKNSRLETTPGSFSAYRSKYKKSTNACKAFLKNYNSNLSVKNIAKQYNSYLTFTKNNPDSITGVDFSREEIVPGKYRITSKELPKDYIKKWALSTEKKTVYGSLNVHQCDIYALDKETYKIVPDYLFKPAHSFFITIFDGAGNVVGSETLSKQTPQGDFASFDYDSQTIRIKPEYADLFYSGMDTKENSLQLAMESEASEICNYYVFYEPSVLKTPAYIKAICSKLDNVNPLNYDSRNKLQIKSIDASCTGGTITLKNKITAEQLIGINIAKKGKAVAKNINIKIYLIEFNGFYTPDKTNVIPVTLTLKKGSSTIKMKYSKSLKKYQDYVLSETPSQPSLCWFYDYDEYTSITPLK